MMYGPAKKLSRVNANLQQAIAAAERIFEMLDTHSEVARARRTPLSCRRSATPSSSATCSFSYAGAEDATLRGVSFAVRGGQTLAIVGRSGAGKTTLVNLMPRFYDVTGGAITIDGRDMRDVTLASLRGADRASSRRRRCSSTTPLRPTSPTAGPARRRRRSRRRRARPTRTSSSWRSTTATRR